MAECIKCRSFQLCPWATPPEIICSSFKPRTQTNADRIRAMTDEELVKHLACQWKECKNMDVDCDKCLLEWLKEEATQNE